jgi:hypothetical protein
MKTIFGKNKRSLFLLATVPVFGIGLLMLSRSSPDTQISVGDVGTERPASFQQQAEIKSEQTPAGEKSATGAQSTTQPRVTTPSLTAEEKQLVTKAEDYLRRLATDGVSNEDASANDLDELSRRATHFLFSNLNVPSR